MTTVEEHLARRLAHHDGHLLDDDSWGRAPADLRKDYRDLARATLAVLGGPTEAQREAARLAAEVEELRRQRDRYRDAWLSASSGRARARRNGGAR